MNASHSVVYHSSVARALAPAGRTLGPWPEAACFRMDDLPCAANELAQLVLSPAERDYWACMRGVEKRRREWLMGRSVAKEAVRALHPALALDEIEILPDPYGRPVMKQPDRGALSIAHSQGTAVALAARDPEALVGIDLESLEHRTEAFESIAFSPGERALRAALPPHLSHEWALRMWCAKEAAGKALGRGLSAGLLAFQITRAGLDHGTIEIELSDGAIHHLPQLRGRSLTVYTARESNFVFSAIIYQQGAVRMRPSRQEILDYLLQKLGELTQDWDYSDPVTAESLLFTQLGFESLDAVVLCTAIQEHYQTPMPFAELLAEIGQQQRDLSINELTDFVNTHLDSPVAAGNAPRRIQ